MARLNGSAPCATLVLALLWAGWHLPLFFYPGWTSTAWSVYLLFMLGESVILTYVTNLACFGVIAPIATHAMFNTAPRFLGGLFAGTAPDVQAIPFELVMALGGLAVAAILLLVSHGQLAYQPRSAVAAGARSVPLM